MDDNACVPRTNDALCDKETQTESDTQRHETMIVTNPPLENFHVANKEYVDSLIKNNAHGRSVSNFHNPINSLPKNPEKGKRFISTGIGHGWTINCIYEFSGDDEKQWIEIYPEKGCVVWVQYQLNGIMYVFNGITWDKMGISINHADLKNVGEYTHSKIDDHINSKTLHLKEKYIGHRNILDAGIFTHDAIDKHIQNDQNAHFGQNLTKNGVPEFRSIRVSDVSMSSHVATKDYVDSKIQGLKWNKTTHSLFDPSNGIPEACIGNRYICLETIKGWKKNYIYEYNGSEWIEIMPTKEYATYVESGNIYSGDTILFNGSEWIKFGTTENHDNLSNSGVHSHFEIDMHLNNGSIAHFGQDLRESGSPVFSNLFVHGKMDTKLLVVGDHITTGQMQVGNFVLPETQQKRSNFTIVGDDKLNTTYIYASETSNDPINIVHMRARGDVYSPKELLSGTPIGALTYSGHDGEKYDVTSSIKCITTDDYTPKSHGSAIQFSTTMNHTTSPVMNMKIDHDGTINCFCTKDSFSKEDGSFVVNGGIGIGKNLVVGGSLSIGNNLYIHSENNATIIRDNSVGRSNNGIIDICCGNNETRENGGHIIVSGQNSFLAGNTQIKAGIPDGNIELLTGNKQRFIIEKNGRCSILNCDETTSNSTGCLVAHGGIGLGGNLYVGGSSILLGTGNQPIVCPDTKQTEDNSQLNLCGGGNDSPSRGGMIKLVGNNYGREQSGSVHIKTGTSTSGKIHFSTGKISKGEQNDCCVVDDGGAWHILTTTDTNGTGTGAFVVDGGVGVGGKLVAKNIKCLNALQLSLFSSEPDCDEIGTMYFDTTRECIRVFTKHGWRNVAFK